MTTTINITDFWKNYLDATRVIQFYVEDISGHDEIKESFSYIYDIETDEVEFSFNVTTGSIEVPIYYTVNGREFRVEQGEEGKYLVATITISNNEATSTVIARIPAYGKLIRELYEENKSPVGLISPGDYNPTLGSNFYKGSNDNSYVTKDTFEDYVRSSNVEGHILDEVGRKQLGKNEGYYKIIRSLRIKCNALERTADSEGNYYSADRTTNSYLIYGAYTYDLYDSEKNLLIEGVSEVTSHITIVKTNNGERVGIGRLDVPDEGPYKSYNYTYVGHLYYEDFDGVIQTVQSENHVTLERFISVEFGVEEGTPKYYEGGYPLYILGPYAGNTISFSVQVEGTINDQDQVVYPTGNSVTSSFSNPHYRQYFGFVEDECYYDPTTGKIVVKVKALLDNDEDDPFRPSYAKILPSLEKTTFRIYNNGRFVKSFEASYYIIQKSSKIGIIPKKYDSRDSTVPIDMPRKDNGKYVLKVTGGIGIKTAFLGITSEVDPYDKNIVRNWTIRENMDFNSVYSEDDEEDTNKILERQYFFENYSGALEEKIVFITGAYDGTLTEFYIRDYIDRSDVWRRAIYESEVTIVPEIDNTDRTVDLGGNWTYTLDTSTNYFIGSNLLYLFNENNRYYTQRFNLIFTFPPNSGPDYDNFRASIDDFAIMSGKEGEEGEVHSEEGVTYSFYRSKDKIFQKLFGDSETYKDIKDRNSDGKWEKIEIKSNNLEYMSLQNWYQDESNPEIQMYIPTTSEETDYPIESDPGTYLKLTKEDTGYPAFDLDDGHSTRYISEDESPLFFMLTTTNTGCVAKDKEGNQRVNEHGDNLYVDLITTTTGYPAFKVIYKNYVEKYRTLVGIKYSRDKQIYFAFEGIEGDNSGSKKIAKFDILYPQESKITTKDIIRIPTLNPLKFTFKLKDMTGSYEMQEIRFYCGIEGIQPLELLSESNEKIPDPEAEYADYPEVELTKESNKYEVICQTQNDLYPDWRMTSANNTFNYSAPQGNVVEFYDEESSLNYDPSKSYLQIDLKNNLGGSDIIDFTRVKNGTVTTNWWNDWRFFIYNKFVNRFNIACSSGSPELEIKDADNQTIRELRLNRAGLYRLHISTNLGEEYSSSNKILSINIPTGIELYQVEGLQFYDNNPDKPIKGNLRRGKKFLNSQYEQIDTNSSGSAQSSFTLYLWYEGSNIKIDKAKLYFQLSVGSGEGAKTLNKYIIINQNNDSNLQEFQGGGGNLNEFFKLDSYKFDEHGNETPISLVGNSLIRQPISGFNLGFSIFNGTPGRIVLTNDNAGFPFKLRHSISNNDTGFIQTSTKLEIDSPLTYSNYHDDHYSLEERDCYIVGSFISYSYEFKPESYGINDSTIANQPTKSWIISFMDSRNDNRSGNLYYYSPIDLKEFELRSSSAKYGKNIKGRDSNSSFLVNDGYSPTASSQEDNFLRTNNTVFYDYGTDRTCKVDFYHPNLQNDRLTLLDNDENGGPVEVSFVNKAIKDNGIEPHASITVNSTISSSTLFLTTNTDYAAFNWSKTGRTSFNSRLYTNSSTGEYNYANIPLELLNLFGNQLGDPAKSVGWITTISFRLKLKVIPPSGMSDSFETLVIDSSDPTYPGASQYFGLGQEFVNKISVVGENIQPCSEDGIETDTGKKNPYFIIPMSKFSKNSSHTIRIKTTYEGRYWEYYQGFAGTTQGLIYGVKVYKGKGEDKEFIESSTSFDNNSKELVITFTSNLTRDVTLIPCFTNIEYNCLQGNISWTPQNGTIPEYGVQVWRNTDNVGPETNGSAGNFSTHNKDGSNSDGNFWGIYIKSKRDEVLGANGRLNPNNGFSKTLFDCIKGYRVTLEFKVDPPAQGTAPIDQVPTLVRSGYGNLFFIQPGKFVSYQFFNTTQDPSSYNGYIYGFYFYKIWYAFYDRTNDDLPSQAELIGEGGSAGSDQNSEYGDNKYREVFILFPGRSGMDNTIELGHSRWHPKNNSGFDLTQPFPEDCLIPMYLLTGSKNSNGTISYYYNPGGNGYNINYIDPEGNSRRFSSVIERYHMIAEKERGWQSQDDDMMGWRDYLEAGGFDPATYNNTRDNLNPEGPWPQFNWGNENTNGTLNQIEYNNKVLYSIRFTED